uniref:Uncharacterized protein n=1 Tax=Anguilla anguilla TaxID=7936 RepID=A0A0E9TEH0_ANGAN
MLRPNRALANSMKHCHCSVRRSRKM